MAFIVDTVAVAAIALSILASLIRGMTGCRGRATSEAEGGNPMADAAPCLHYDN
jgi:hypothetical protein